MKQGTATRRQAREWAVQVLFQQDMNPGPLDGALESFWAERPDADVSARAFSEQLVRGVIGSREQVDALIRSYAQNWDLGRMGVVDRNVMRLALYEMLHRSDIPPVVSINEAVDLARYFSSAESARFVNGILDRARRDIARPARRPLTGPLPQSEADSCSSEETG